MSSSKSKAKAKTKSKAKNKSRAAAATKTKTTRPTAVKSSRKLPVVLCASALFVGYLCFFSGRFYINTFGRLGFDSVLYTLTGGLGGVQSGQVTGYILKGLVPAIAFSVLTVWLLVRQPWLQARGKYESSLPSRKLACWCSILLALALIIFAAFDVELVDYVMHQNTNSHLYEAEYADPADTRITFPEEKRNLIYIMLESMETSYLSEDLGGAMEENLIPELYDLANENLCFSNSNAKVGGYYTTKGATWTIGSMVAQTAGIPLKTPTEDVNQYGASGEDFLPGVTTLTDILHDAGYTQSLMVGSNAAFGGRKVYFEQHGIDAIYDIYTARADGIVPKDYFVWWGMEDLYLFEYAKQELVELASGDSPFAFTMLTVDTHHVGGYQCQLCEESKSGESYDQSISCSSRQVADFVAWIQAQEFYENTSIIIVGDHESMDNGYFERMVDGDYQRLLYNCFINVPTEATNVTNRQFAAVDLFPTTLAALGCSIEGDRLGLGTNLFSGKKTLTERWGIDYFNNELAKASSYYEENFWE